MKTCGKCKIEKELVLFYKSNTRKDGHAYYCKECQEEYRRKHPKKYKISDKAKEYRKQYNKSEKGKEAIKKYRKSDKAKETYKQYIKNYRSMGKIKEISTRYARSEKGKESRKQYLNSEKYRDSLKKRINTEYRKEYRKEYAHNKAKELTSYLIYNMASDSKELREELKKYPLLIDAYRQHLKIKRLLKQRQNG